MGPLAAVVYCRSSTTAVVRTDAAIRVLHIQHTKCTTPSTTVVWHQQCSQCLVWAVTLVIIVSLLPGCIRHHATVTGHVQTALYGR